MHIFLRKHEQRKKKKRTRSVYFSSKFCIKLRETGSRKISVDINWKKLILIHIIGYERNFEKKSFFTNWLICSVNGSAIRIESN